MREYVCVWWHYLKPWAHSWCKSEIYAQKIKKKTKYDRLLSGSSGDEFLRSNNVNESRFQSSTRHKQQPWILMLEVEGSATLSQMAWPCQVEVSHVSHVLIAVTANGSHRQRHRPHRYMKIESLNVSGASRGRAASRGCLETYKWGPASLMCKFMN